MSQRLRPDVSKMDKQTRLHYARSCQSKNAYPTAACALLQCLDRHRQGDAGLWAYGPCVYCGMFHVGHAADKKSRESVAVLIETLYASLSISSAERAAPQWG